MPDSIVPIYAASLFAGSAGAWAVARWGGRFGLTDVPSARSSHRIPTPKGGGIGLLVTFIAASVLTHYPIWFWATATGVSALGLLTDRFDLSPYLRLMIQFLLAGIFVYGVTTETSAHDHSMIWLGFLVVYIVGTTNFYNFMDGINGMAALSGLVAFFFLAGASLFHGGFSGYSETALCVMLACIGFLPFNFPRARVFMGDVGSVLLGFVFAGMVVAGSESYWDLIGAAGFLFPFYADGLSTLAIRLGKGHSLFEPHRKHLYQILVNEFNVEHWRVTLGYVTFQIVVSASAMIVWQVEPTGLIPLYILYFIAFATIDWKIRKAVPQKR